jgi:hypothetical protein
MQEPLSYKEVFALAEKLPPEQLARLICELPRPTDRVGDQDRGEAKREPGSLESRQALTWSVLVNGESHGGQGLWPVHGQ